SAQRGVDASEPGARGLRGGESALRRRARPPPRKRVEPQVEPALVQRTEMKGGVPRKLAPPEFRKKHPGRGARAACGMPDRAGADLAEAEMWRELAASSRGGPVTLGPVALSGRAEKFAELIERPFFARLPPGGEARPPVRA